MRFSLATVALSASVPIYSSAFRTCSTPGFIGERTAFNTNWQHVTSSSNDVLILNMNKNGNSFDDEQRKNFFSVVTAASIFLAASTSGVMLPVENAFAATASPAATTTAKTAVVPLAKEKQNASDTKAKFDAAVKALKDAEKDLKQAKGGEAKAVAAIADAQAKVIEAKKSYLVANDSLTAARGKQNVKDVEELTAKVGKAKKELAAAENALAQAKVAKASAAKVVAAKVGVVLDAEQSVRSTRVVLTNAEAKLQNTSAKISLEKKEVADNKAKGGKAATEKKKQEKIKADKAAAEKRKEEQIKAEKKKQQERKAAEKAAKAAAETQKKDAIAAQKATKIAREKAAKEAEAKRLRKAEEAKSLKAAELKLKGLESKRVAYERSVTETSKVEKKLEADIAAQLLEVKKLKSDITK